MRWLFGVLAFWATAAVAEPARLQPVPSLDPSAVTVSGLSSGAFFAHQVHVTHSSLVAGAGLIAGGPYGCAEQDEPPWLAVHPYARTVAAVSICTRIARSSVEVWAGFWSGLWGTLPEAPDLELSIDVTNTALADGAIDDPANLADDRVWLFSGTGDATVPASTVAVLAAYYQRAGVAPPRLAVVDDVPAGHGLPVEAFDGESRHPKLGCNEERLPFVVDCDRDAAELLLRHLYPDGFRATPGEPRRARLAAFDQTEFFDAGDRSASLAATGYLYIPDACGEAGDTTCRLHVAFHGCEQHTGAIDDDFYWDGGYNRWAEANAIVVLYPQAVPWTPAWDPFGWGGNPKGCWDWWGYGGEGYAGRDGIQMRAVRTMIGRLLAE